MKAKRLLGAALAIGLGLGAITGTTVAEAQGKKKGEPAAPAAPGVAPTTKKNIVLIPKGVGWGMSPKQVAAAIDNVLDEAFKPLYKKVQPGVKMKALDAQLAEEKSAFRRSRIDFGNIPTGIDSTPLKGEYSYNNKESMMTYTRDGTKMHFFFIRDRLWKIIDERALGEGSAHGKDFADAASKLAGTFGVPGRVIEPDFDKGRYGIEVDWKDAATHLRAVQRGDAGLAIILEDNVTLGSLDALRTNKPQEDNGIDPAVAAAIRKGDPEPPPADEKKDGKKK
ncbi:MAG TPA: hypothetical protein VLS89_04830 [Candidatus Nanopelagicales bacterium]|nr:hypothetical protein [Candidatus Nanopelagicales bacterium]